ncbi:hypothetical protein M4D55_00170 [Metabacillus idriensis]|nr:hypothetical protein [Metabacillus idriensis]MCM3594197.1 hypothetical protein [Metabacillus idriensis]
MNTTKKTSIKLKNAAFGSSAIKMNDKPVRGRTAKGFGRLGTYQKM